VHEEEEKLTSAIKNAEKLHGHLGPFLVIGVRMGKTVKRILNLNTGNKSELEATAKIPLLTPISCILTEYKLQHIALLETKNSK